ncbi:MAG: type IX secretion system membrane protein PorP/SprF [Lewinellaceae bacterium]|nr:type IX secretion system membrane protein PorP/SprF [Saprospiraceae bacterium]MCB9344110.1 type IX secretion system membrane protein PorP/SprF [Lewinellaceae bacterium]
MRKTFLHISWFLGLFPALLWGQQDPMFTNYQFNSLTFNPAYAGSNEHLTVNLVHRQQWLGFDGAPTTQSLLAHTPLKNERLGLGVSLVNDKIGPTGSFGLSGAYAYRLLVGKKKNMKLSLGLQASIANWHGDWLDIVVEQGSDPAFESNYNAWLPNFGAGAYLSSDRFYAGLSCPKLLENNIQRVRNGKEEFFGQSYRHWYGTAGAIFPIDGDQVVFRPSMLIKGTGLFSSFKTDSQKQHVGSPTAINLDASFFLRQTFWLGLTFRTAVQVGNSSNDSVDLWFAWYMRNGLRIGAAYDITLSKLQSVGQRSFELMAGYEFDIKVKQVASPRYF